MWRTKPKKACRPDPLEAEIFEAFAASEHEVISTAENPFLARRVMVAISQEELQHGVELINWSLGLGVALRAVPTFAAVAIAAGCVFWYSARMTPTSGAVNNRVARADDRVMVNGDYTLVSNDDMLSIVLGWRPADVRGEQ
ncbi:MAG: hypothetical protein ABIZ95_01610 [Pyrinomonadaceae bacterium]